MSNNQIDYCGNCKLFESCPTRKGQNVEPECSKEANK